MLNSKESNQRATANEAVVDEQFKNLNYLVKRLDSKSSKRRRPDFLISNSSGPQMLCEVKTIAAAAYMPDKEDKDKGIHVSTLDETLRKFRVDVEPIKKIDERLVKAVRQRDALIADFPKLEPLPFLVAIFFDPFADDFLYFYPSTFNKDVSGILTIKEDVARNKAFDKLSDEEKERYLKNPKLMDDDLPPSSMDFVLLQNEAALRKVPRDFERQCLA
jgi:hypothetical protein